MGTNKTKIRKNIKFILSVLIFLFGLGLAIFAHDLEIKLFGLVYIILSMIS